jgi:predicted RNA methylase
VKVVRVEFCADAVQNLGDVVDDCHMWPPFGLRKI